MKPILFNAEMVRAILDGRKTATRRVVKLQFDFEFLKFAEWDDEEENFEFHYENATEAWDYLVKPPYSPGDILYVRETWARAYGNGIYYAADYEAHDVLDADNGDVSVSKNLIRWHPSIHMPKEAARIFLRVTDVRVEQLQEVTRYDAMAEGCNAAIPMNEFKAIWDSTIKPADRERYGFSANPWVWVIEFERCEKPKEENP